MSLYEGLYRPPALINTFADTKPILKIVSLIAEVSHPSLSWICFTNQIPLLQAFLFSDLMIQNIPKGKNGKEKKQLRRLRNRAKRRLLEKATENDKNIFPLILRACSLYCMALSHKLKSLPSLEELLTETEAAFHTELQLDGVGYSTPLSDQLEKRIQEHHQQL